MRNIVFIVYVMGIFLTGCLNTQGNLKINGKVIDESTKAPIPGRKIFVKGLVGKNNDFEQIETGQFSTDSSGSFNFSLRKIKDAYYYNFSIVGDSDYSFRTEKIGLPYLKSNSNDLSFSLSKLADFTILISRKSKTPVCDTLYLSWKSDGIDCINLYPYKINNYGLSSSQALKWIGGNVKSSIKTRAFADKKTSVRWALIRNGRVKTFTDTITCKRDITNTLSFTY